MIGGAMGAGKSTTCRILKRRLDNCAFLDGDWCWDMHPFRVTDRTRALVLDNICHVLNSFLTCGEFENVVFCWVLHRQEIIDSILGRLELRGWETVCVSLICSEAVLAGRLRRDVEAGLREAGVIDRALECLPLYGALDTIKLDVSDISAADAAEAISRL